MVERDRWMRWAPQERRGKVTKRPITAGGRSASSTDSRTWCSYQVARSSKAGAGLGFALGDGIGCIDLDGCIRADGTLEPWAEEILDRCPATFVEVSQSGAGLHIFGLLPEGRGRNLRSSGLDVEVYSTGRFMAVTGRRFRGASTRLADITEVASSVS